MTSDADLLTRLAMALAAGQLGWSEFLAQAAPLHAAQGLIDAMAQALEAELGVTHSTIQIECHECEAISH